MDKRDWGRGKKRATGTRAWGVGSRGKGKAKRRGTACGPLRCSPAPLLPPWDLREGRLPHWERASGSHPVKRPPPGQRQRQRGRSGGHPPFLARATQCQNQHPRLCAHLPDLGSVQGLKSAGLQPQTPTLWPMQACEGGQKPFDQIPESYTTKLLDKPTNQQRVGSSHRSGDESDGEQKIAATLCAGSGSIPTPFLQRLLPLKP